MGENMETREVRGDLEPRKEEQAKALRHAEGLGRPLAGAD